MMWSGYAQLRTSADLSIRRQRLITAARLASSNNNKIQPVAAYIDSPALEDTKTTLDVPPSSSFQRACEACFTRLLFPARPKMSCDYRPDRARSAAELRRHSPLDLAKGQSVAAKKRRRAKMMTLPTVLE